METNHRINSIDIARLFAAILVIAIHTQAFMWFSDRLFSSKRLSPEELLRYFGYSFETDKSICFCIAGLFCLYIYTKPYTVA